jgi:hypothetical protein
MLTILNDIFLENLALFVNNLKQLIIALKLIENIPIKINVKTNTTNSK